MLIIGQRSLSRNSIYNILSQIFIVVLAFLSIPYIVSKLGSEAFGLLSLLWMFVGYFGFFDLGVGQAAVKFLSESVARGDREDSANVIRTVVRFSLIFGIVSGMVVVIIALIGIDNIFHITPSLRSEATISLLLLACCLPAVLVQVTLKSVPISLNRFDILNLVQGVSGLLQWGGTAFVLWLNGRLILVILLTVFIRYLVMFIYLGLTLRFFPEVKQRVQKVTKTSFKHIIRFGGWVSVSQIFGPVIIFSERFLIAGLLSLSWVTFFTVPSDTVSRFLIIPISLVSTLFPFMSGGWQTDEGKQQVKSVYQRSVKYIFLTMLPLVCFLAVSSGTILHIWLGEEFAAKSSIVLTFFSIGILFNSLAQLPYSALQALGRPDLPAKLLLILVPIHIILFISLTWLYGINGAAFAWMIRVTVEAVILFIFTGRYMSSVHVAFDISFFWKGTGLILLGGCIIMLAKFISVSLVFQFVVIVIIGCLYCAGIWRFVFDEKDKQLVLRILPLRLIRSSAN